MAETLVSDLCDLTPAAHWRFFVAAMSVVSWCTVFLDCFRPVFSTAFLLAITRPYIVFLQILALKIACIFVGERSMHPHQRPALRPGAAG
jgi:hypothetical protein